MRALEARRRLPPVARWRGYRTPPRGVWTLHPIPAADLLSAGQRKKQSLVWNAGVFPALHNRVRILRPVARRRTRRRRRRRVEMKKDLSRKNLDKHPDFFWTVSEVAELLQVNMKTIYYGCEHGEIPGAYRLGRTIRIHRKTFLDHIKKGSSTAWEPRSDKPPRGGLE